MSRRLMRAFIVLFAAALLAPFAALAWFAATAPPDRGAAPFSLLAHGLVESAWLGLTVTAITVAVGFALAYLVTYRRFRGRRLLAKLLLAPLLLPPFAVASIYQELLSATGPLAGFSGDLLPWPVQIRSTFGFIFSLSVSLYPLSYLLCRIAMEHHGEAPFELGQSLGLSHGQAIRKILLPLCLPALGLGGGLVLMEATGDWPTAVILSVDSTSSVLHEIWIGRAQPRAAAWLSLLLAGAVLLLFMLLGLSRRLSAASFRHVSASLAQPRRRAAGRRHPRPGPLALAACALPLLLGFAVPLAAILWLLSRTLHRVDLAGLLDGCLDSAALIAAVALIGLGLAAALTFSDQARPGPLSRLLVKWLTISYLLPAMVFALGVLVLADKVLFFVERYSDAVAFWILAYALGLRFLCFLLVPLQVGLAGLPQRLGELGAALGLRPWRSFTALYVPQLRRFLMLGLLLVVLQTLRETAVTVALHPFGFEPIALKVFGLVRINMLPESAVWLLVLILLGIGPLSALEDLASPREPARLQPQPQPRRSSA